MPIISVCPYCREGKVRAPKEAVGHSATCPRCRCSFTIFPTDEVADQPPRPAAAPAPEPERTPPPGHTDPKQETIADVANTDVAVPAAKATAAPALLRRAAPAVAPPPEREPPSPVALVGVILFGVGLVASQLPYGRVAAVVVCAIGL